MSDILGKGVEGPVAIDILRLVTTNLGVVGNPGAGKSQTIRKILELAAGVAQRIELDVEDEFYTLREKSPNLIIAGGQDGDCPATVENAAALARFLLETGLDAVIQLNGLGFAGQEAFIARFLTAMIEAPRNQWHPVLLVIDETQRYAPNNAVAESLEAIKNYVLQGRKRTFGFVMGTPRIADVSTKVRGTINNWILGRASQTVDVAAVSDLLGIRRSSDQAKGLPRLDPGQFWAFGPAISVEPTLITVGAVETTHLQPGQRDVPTPPAPGQIREMLARLQPAAIDGTVKTDQKYSDPIQAEAIQAAKREAFERGVIEGRRMQAADDAERIKVLESDIQSALGYLAPHAKIEGSIGIIDVPQRKSPAIIDNASLPIARPDKAASEHRRRQQQEKFLLPSKQPVPRGTSLGSAAAKMLPIICRHEPLSWQEVGVLGGLVTGNGYWYGGVRELRDRQLVTEADGLVRSTHAAADFVDPIGPRLTPGEIEAIWCRKLAAPAPDMLGALMNTAGEAVSTAELADRIGRKPGNGYWYRGMKALRDAGLIEEPKAGHYQVIKLLRG